MTTIYLSNSEEWCDSCRKFRVVFYNKIIEKECIKKETILNSIVGCYMLDRNCVE